MATSDEQRALSKHIHDGDIDATHALADAILQRTPNDPDALTAKARVVAATGTREDALALLDRALKSAQTHVDARVYKGALLLDLRTDDALATALLEGAAKDAPDHAPAHFNLGRARARTGDFARAVKEIDRAIALDDQNPYYLFARARLDVDMAPNDPRAVEKSFERLTKVVKLSPGLVEAWLVLAELQVRGGNAKDAATNLETALRASPDHPMLLDALTNAALVAGDAKRAIAAAEKLV